MELPLNERHRQAGATLGPWHEWIVPLRFHDPIEEYWAVRRQTGLLDLSWLGVLEVRGTDRISFLHNLLTNDIKALAPGSGCQACLLTVQARLVAAMLVLAEAEAHWLIVDRRCAEAVCATLGRFIITEDVTVTDRTPHYSVVALQGPMSVSGLASLLSAPPALAHVLDHARATMASLPLHLISQSVTGEPGILMMARVEHAPRLWDVLTQDVQAESGRPQQVQPVGWEAWNILRIEAGIPWYGVDMDEENLLPETGLEAQTVSDTKGCYLGQEIIARLHTYGSVSQKLMGLVLDGQDVPNAGSPILKDGARLGEITSACFSPSLARPIALGYVKRPFYESGTRVEVLSEGRVLAAKLAKRPIYSPN